MGFAADRSVEQWSTKPVRASRMARLGSSLYWFCSIAAAGRTVSLANASCLYPTVDSRMPVPSAYRNRHPSILWKGEIPDALIRVSALLVTLATPVAAKGAMREMSVQFVAHCNTHSGLLASPCSIRELDVSWPKTVLSVPWTARPCFSG